MSARRIPTAERGLALVTSLLLLMIITIIALSMFRSFAVQEHVAGNLREKERAVHAAESAQQFAEWWLTQGNNAAIGGVTCANGTLSANAAQGQICNLTPVQVGFNPATLNPPWPIQVTFLPVGMSATPGVNGVNGDPPYALSPAFYITQLGPAGDGQGVAYQVDAYGTGTTALASASATVAVVESSFEIQQGVVNRGGL
jgi:type IV pilus assembly protein PilX